MAVTVGNFYGNEASASVSDVGHYVIIRDSPGTRTCVGKWDVRRAVGKLPAQGVT
jgi:hypothetical protein